MGKGPLMYCSCKITSSCTRARTMSGPPKLIIMLKRWENDGRKIHTDVKISRDVKVSKVMNYVCFWWVYKKKLCTISLIVVLQVLLVLLIKAWSYIS